jgi:hypothetical protein
MNRDRPLNRSCTLHLDSDFPPLTPTECLTGWRRELCIELLGDGAARIFVRAMEQGSHKATELKQGVLFSRLDPRFTDVAGCVDATRADLERLVDTARRIRPEQENLFAAVSYDRTAWAGVERGIDQWARRPRDTFHPSTRPTAHLGGQRSMPS